MTGVLQPYSRSITARKRLAQELRNELFEYKRYANESTQTARLARMTRMLYDIARLETGGGGIVAPIYNVSRDLLDEAVKS